MLLVKLSRLINSSFLPIDSIRKENLTKFLKKAMLLGKDISRFANLVCFITEKIPQINTVQLVKTIYFFELEYRIKFGESLTEVPIIRIDMGPVPANYKQHFARLKKDGYIDYVKSGNSIKHTCLKQSFFTEIEIDVFSPFIDKILEIRHKRPSRATDIIREASYETRPMERFLEQEKRDGKQHIGWKVFRFPFFTDDDVDSLAKYRRAYRDHLIKAKPYSEEDAKIDMEVIESLKPFLETTNSLAT